MMDSESDAGTVVPGEVPLSAAGGGGGRGGGGGGGGEGEGDKKK